VSKGTEDTLFSVLKTRRELVVACWKAKVRGTVGAEVSNAELLDEIPAFVDEIIAALYRDAIPLPSTSGTAGEHGAQRLRLQFDVSEVVREYGLLHECIIEIARDAGAEVNWRDQQVICGWITHGIADAVAQYGKRRDEEKERQQSQHLGFIAHELRNPLSAARAAFQRLRGNELAAGGRSVDLVERSLRRSAEMIDNALSHASLTLGVEPQSEPVVLADLLRDIDLDASIEAQARGVTLTFVVDGDPVIAADPRLLRSALFNLVQNGLKFSPAGSTVAIRAHGAPDQATIHVADACGGLPPGRVDDLFAPLVQRGENRSGFGLGLAIARQAVEAQGGRISVRDVPGMGCVFTVRLGHADAAGNPGAAPRIES